MLIFDLFSELIAIFYAFYLRYRSNLSVENLFLTPRKMQISGHF